jgi:hypothetical protein
LGGKRTFIGHLERSANIGDDAGDEVSCNSDAGYGVKCVFKASVLTGYCKFLINKRKQFLKNVLVGLQQTRPLITEK